MSLIRRIILSLALLAGAIPAFAQVPAPVPALPDTERKTFYSISASTCSCNVNFAIFGDGTDFANWVEVFINGVRVNYNDATYGWTITSPSGPLANLARPISNAVLTFTNAQTGVVDIVGARRPRRVSQFSENAGVSARNLNQVLTDIIAQNRETWDKINDVSGRAMLGVPGDTILPMPNAAARAGKFLFFDPTGTIPLFTTTVPGNGTVIGPGSTTIGGLAFWGNTAGTVLANNPNVFVTGSNGFSAANFVIGGDVILAHPLTPAAAHDPGSNIGLGKAALASFAPDSLTEYNTAVGFEALVSMTNSNHNTALGAWTLSSVTGTGATNNTAVGIDSMRFHTTGSNNVGVGEHTLTNSPTSNFGTAVGVNAMQFAGGDYNVGIGFQAMSGNVASPVTGAGNIAIGANSMNDLHGAANFNTGIGYFSLPTITTGSGNTVIGYLGGLLLTTGSNNILIGSGGAIADVPTAATNDFLNIQNQIYGIANGGIGIGVTTPGGVGTLRLKLQAFAALTACSGTIQGTLAMVTDSTTIAWGATITGGGTGSALALCDGVNWTVVGK